MKIELKNLDSLKAAAERGDWQAAIAIASTFSKLGDEKKAIHLANTAYSNPRFVVQLGGSVEEAKDAGKAALIARYQLGAPQ